MDYSKKGIEEKQLYIRSTSRKLSTKTRLVAFRVFIIFIISLIIIGTNAFYGYIKGLIDSAPDISQINVVPQELATYVYDKDGNAIEQLIGAQSNRNYVTIDEIPDVLQKAFIAIEDKRFYEHDGIDVRGIFRVAFKGISEGDFAGASTLTQQLLKNQVFDGGSEPKFFDKVKRKVQEQYLAIQLEDELEKDEILEYYLNTINLGAGTYGVQTASMRYFNKDAKDINLSEAAVIAAITQYPADLNPITNPENNSNRRAAILINMLEQGYCTQEEYDAAIVDDVYARIESVNKEMDAQTYYSYFVDELIGQVMEDLQEELGYTQAQASNAIYSGGLSIYTTMDPVIQNICDEIYADESNFPDMGDSLWELDFALSIQKNDGKETVKHYHGNDLVDFYKDFDDPDDLYVDEDGKKFSLLFLDKEDMQKKIDGFKKAVIDEGDIILGERAVFTIQPQSSVVIMDQHTGHVSAIIGGRGEKIGNRTLNRATSTTRQPGSTFKIVSTYLPALDSAGMTLASVQDDSKYFYPGTDTEVRNWSRIRNYEGLSTLRKGIWDSMNIVTVKTLVDITPQVGFDYLKKLGFTTLIESKRTPEGRVVSDLNPSMALGGLTDGVTNLELTASYAAIANGGIYIEPSFYTKIFDKNGNLLLEKVPYREQVIKESTAWLLTNAMEDVVKIGTGKTARLQEIDMPVAGKTGSTSDYYDLWFSGYSPYYTASIWSGFDTNRYQENRSYQRDIWRKIMEQIHIRKQLEKKSFTMPDSIVTAKVCTKSGKLAVDGVCNRYVGGDTTIVEYFAKGTEPTERCDVHVKASICTESNALATHSCPARSQKEAVYLDKIETGNTDDTPHLLPRKTCSIHTGPPRNEDDDNGNESEHPPRDNDETGPPRKGRRKPPSRNDDDHSNSDDHQHNDNDQHQDNDNHDEQQHNDNHNENQHDNDDDSAGHWDWRNIFGNNN